MKSYVFPAQLERDGDGWRASVPSLGISARGSSWKTALANLQDAVQMAVEDILQSDGTLPPDGKHYDFYTAVVNVGLALR